MRPAVLVLVFVVPILAKMKSESTHEYPKTSDHALFNRPAERNKVKYWNRFNKVLTFAVQFNWIV